LLASVATGISETIHGLSNTAVSAFHQLQPASQFDATTRPIAAVVEMLRDISGALAVSAREITDEVVALQFAKPVQIRRQRELGQDGFITDYGGGRLPAARMLVEERFAAARIQRWWLQVHAKIRKNEENKETDAAKKIQKWWRRLKTKHTDVGDVASQIVASRKRTMMWNIKRTFGVRHVGEGWRALRNEWEDLRKAQKRTAHAQDSVEKE
jgi:hypothetical protein